MGVERHGHRAPRAGALAGVAMACVLGACTRELPKAQADGSPHLRPGLWSQSLTTGRGQPMSTTVCLDQASTGLLLGAASREAGTCRREVRREGNAWRFVSNCRIGGGAELATSGLASGDFSSSFTVRTVTSVSGAPVAFLDGRRETLLVGRWVGACPKGMAPGDVGLADGRRLRSRRLREIVTAFAGA